MPPPMMMRMGPPLPPPPSEIMAIDPTLPSIGITVMSALLEPSALMISGGGWSVMVPLGTTGRARPGVSILMRT